MSLLPLACSSLSISDNRVLQLPLTARWAPLVSFVFLPSSEPSDSPLESRDILLGGLLSPDVSESICLSRYLSSLYRRASPYLMSRLCKYEALHRRCGPGTPLYDKSVRQLASAHNSMGLAECSYLVWTPGNHLGDRMVSMASAFLYALLTRRVFLVDMAKDMAGLFCEPFSGAS